MSLDDNSINALADAVERMNDKVGTLAAHADLLKDTIPSKEEFRVVQNELKHLEERIKKAESANSYTNAALMKVVMTVVTLVLTAVVGLVLKAGA